MAKSMRSKREKRLRAIRRELVQTVYDQKEAAKRAVQEAARLPVKPTPKISTDVEMTDGGQTSKALKPIRKKLKMKIKIAKKKSHGKGKIRRKHSV
ncbi:uncharacterized protein LOC111374988 [Olea europaea var. sylvestris]|uniref:uncharacterized protein LOC111374988 n=1 Tax=Olea europaea var. sylvestris TaxID=158386 RepID=UPI000C1D8AC2|nr:uncharacterized protein LOC111374988 [Olea europaea var. sylvestris]